MSSSGQAIPLKFASPPFLIRAIFAIAGGTFIFTCASIFFLLVFDLYHLGRIYPGVSVGGVELAGKTPEEASLALAQQLVFPQQGKIAFQVDDQVWVARPLDLGLSLDVQSSVERAYAWGRTGNPLRRLYEQLRAWRVKVDVPPRLVYDERLASDYLAQIAAQVNRPTVEATLRVEGTDVVALPGQVGRVVDQEATLLLLRAQLNTLMDGIVPVIIRESPPLIMDASEAAEIARQILGQPLVLQLPEPPQQADTGPWLMTPDQLAKKLVFERQQTPEGWKIYVKVDEDALREYLQGIDADISRSSQNARFIFNDDTRQLELIQPAIIGRSLDIEATIQEINRRLLQGEHTVGMVVTYMPPQIGDDAQGEALGITELVQAYTSYFRGSSPERMRNIQLAAARFHGLLVPPGAVFSMAEYMGDVTLDNGYAEAWIIYGGRTIKGVGGGVCQVSTTLFRTAFFAGFPIIERHPHAYRVSYYEQTARGVDANLAGLDATVFVPLVDFKFKNDTPYWLLMETYFNATAHSLTWKFYSTSDGRRVEWETSGPQNIVEPPEPLYEENPELAKGEIIQVDWAAEGADIRVTRTVYRDGTVLFSDVFETHYMPWRDVFQYGPGTKLPKGAKKKQTFLLDLRWLFLPLAFLAGKSLKVTIESFR